VKRTRQTGVKNITGWRIRAARLRRSPSVSQDNLAGKLAAKGITIDQTAISRIERRKRYLMDYEVAAIAKCLKVSVAWLYGESGTERL
jgi:transcriptional regulator with XRE-family HTH domain